MQKNNEKDSIEKEYLADPRRFADVCNGLIYGGEQRIFPTQLQEVSVEKFALLQDKSGNVYTEKRFRDIIRKITIKRDNKALYMLAALENQTEVERFMILRTMGYDFLNYQDELKNGQFFGPDKKRYLPPVVTFVLYWGEEPWTAPCTLHDVIYFPDEYIRNLTPNYRFHLVDLSRTDEEFRKRFCSDFSYVLYCLTNRTDKRFFRNVLDPNSPFFQLEESSRNLVTHVLGMQDEIIIQKEGGRTMCRAWKELVKELKDEGRQEGMEKGRQEGMEKGRLEGMEKGRLEERKSLLEKLYASGAMTAEQIQTIFGNLQTVS